MDFAFFVINVVFNIIVEECRANQKKNWCLYPAPRKRVTVIRVKICVGNRYQLLYFFLEKDKETIIKII
jgi:hypothetical protein